MSSQAAYEGLVRGKTLQWIQGRADEILAYPDDTFTRRDLNDELERQLEAHRQQNVIATVGSVTRTKGQGTTYEALQFKVRSNAVQEARQCHDTRDPLCPCGHGGVHNAGDHYECMFDLCDREFHRDELEVGQ